MEESIDVSEIIKEILKTFSKASYNLSNYKQMLIAYFHYKCLLGIK
jgi:hypothetical protein